MANFGLFFSSVISLSNHISFYQLQLDRYRHPSGERQGPSTSPDPSKQDRERGKQRLKTKTLDGSALEDDQDTSMQRDSPRHHGGEGDKDGSLEGSFIVIIFMGT